MFKDAHIVSIVQQCQRLFVITGAGISTESGIPDYRSEHVGLFARTQRRPVEHGMFVRSARMRQSYWARSFTGWTSFLRHLPNAAHLALSRWERAGRLHWLVTQNVDALHRKSGSRGFKEMCKNINFFKQLRVTGGEEYGSVI